MPHRGDDYPLFLDAVQKLLHGDFSRLEPLFNDDSSPAGLRCQIVAWYEKRYFDEEPRALEEAFACACFLGQAGVADFLLRQGLDPSAGAKTGLNGFHWAVDRGQLETVKMLVQRKVPLEIKNMYGGTVLGTAVWSAIHEPKPDHIAIIETLIGAGARLDAAGFPTGNERVDELLRRHGVKG
jgi:hypothetical protein